jgi:hypothetical protein
MQSTLHNFCIWLNQIWIVTFIQKAILYTFSHEENNKINKSIIGNCDLFVWHSIHDF